MNLVANKVMSNKETGDYVVDLTIYSGQIELILSLTKQDVESINRVIKEVL